MVTLESDQLAFRFPEVHEEAACTIDFQRTLRIPNDWKDYPLPPGLVNFPLWHLDYFARRVSGFATDGLRSDQPFPETVPGLT